MACRCGGTFVTPILAIAGLVAAGAAGYKLMNGCGTCTDKEAALVSTSIEDNGSCALCPGHESTECAAHVQTASAKEAGCCSEKDAKVETVAAESKTECCASKDAAPMKTVTATETKKEACCSEGKTETAAEKVCKEGADGCTGDGKNGCCGGCDGQKKEEKKDGTVATSGN